VATAKPKKLSFHATKVTAEVDPEVQTLGFEVAREGEPNVFFNMTNEESGSVRVWWGDGKLRRDERVVAVASAALEKGRFLLEFKEPDAVNTGPYKGVELTFDELDEELGPAVAEAFALLLGPPPPPPVLVGHRKRGNPQLGVLAASRNEWRVRVGEEIPLELVVSNTGGGTQGLSIEIGGAALAHVDVRDAKAQGKKGKLETQKTAVRAVLEHARVDADYDIDRKAVGKDAPPAPKFPFTVLVSGKAAGQALITIRVTPSTRDGRGSAMVGRTIFVDP
jgi:hypothetical protein